MKREGSRLAAVLLVAVLAAVLSGCGGPGSQRQTQPSTAPHATPKAVYAALRDAPEKLGADNTTITIGDPAAVVTVHLYEDPRCPYCKEFEMTGGGPVLNDWIMKRKAKAEYTLASFLDDRLGGIGSKRTVNALRAALDAGKFAEYHVLLYQNQPDEATDDFTVTRLLELASRVDGLRSTAFDTAVTTMKYRDFVARSQQAYLQAGTSSSGRPGPGTPTADVNGTRIPAAYNGVLFEGTTFTSLLTMASRMANSAS